MYRLIESVRLLVCVLIGVFAICPDAVAQEIEPNNFCAQPQDGPVIVPPAVVTGSISAADATARTDVDFFRFTAAPGLELRVPTSFDHRVGVFDDQCMQVAVAVDRTPLDFEVPESGSFVLGVASRFDNSFSGNGSINRGPYQLQFTVQPPRIGSIVGRLVDAVSGEPLVGASPTLARVELRRCEGESCFEFVARQSVDAQGMFRFEVDFRNRRIEVGSFELAATASEFERVSVRFEVGESEDFDAGDLALVPPPVLFSNIEPCSALLPQGGRCTYSVRIRNNTIARFTGMAYSLVESGFGASRFEASTRPSGSTVRRARVRIPALDSRVVRFSFDVPSFVANGTNICTQLYFGFDPSPLFNTARRGNLFCLRKGDSGFEVMSAEESREAFDLLNGSASPLMRPLPQQ